MKGKYLFTSESVTEGHPDKMCDQISDAILDEILLHDKEGRVACETMVSSTGVYVMGEVSTKFEVDITKVVRKIIKEIGYCDKNRKFNYSDCKVTIDMNKQSEDIAVGVKKSLEIRNGSTDESEYNGAGDQGMMYGFACDETPELMPLPITLAHRLAMQLAIKRKKNDIDYLLPDGKTQVTVEYMDEKPIRIDSIIISAQHKEEISMEKLFDDIYKEIILPIIPMNLLDKETKIYINPTGRFTIGGPEGDCGLTGRKIIVDTYGGYSRHGGGAFSGKDSTKVDRSAAYMARYIAKNIVKAGLAKKCEVQLAYSIGVANPVSVMVDTFGTSKYTEVELCEVVKKVFDLRPRSIIKMLDLQKPIFRKLSTYGHMGREDLDVKWEMTDKVNELLECLGDNTTNDNVTI